MLLTAAHARHWTRGVRQLEVSDVPDSGAWRSTIAQGLRKGCATWEEIRARMDAFPTLYQQRLGLHEPYALRPLLSLPHAAACNWEETSGPGNRPVHGRPRPPDSCDASSRLQSDGMGWDATWCYAALGSGRAGIRLWMATQGHPANEVSSSLQCMRLVCCGCTS
jgi:hypothetical protein